MRRVAPGIALLCTVLLLTAGCLGGGSANVGTQSSDTASSPSMQDNGTANMTHVPTGPTWNRTYLNGTVQGTNLVVVSNGGSNETFNVTSGALNLTVNVTAHSGNLWVTILPPGCQDSFVGSSCSYRADTTNGTSTWSTTNPTPGEWTVSLFKGDPGTTPVDYTVEAAVLQPAGS